MRTKNLVMLSLFTLLLVTCAYGQEGAINANIQFAFTVGAKVLPAGQYAFTLDAEGRTVTVRGIGASAMAPVVTRLAAGIHTTPNDAHVVFDKVGDVYTLSEIWIPGLDGCVLNITKEKHAHQIVDVPK